jgi:hypothetical protein
MTAQARWMTDDASCIRSRPHSFSAVDVDVEDQNARAVVVILRSRRDQDY